MQSRIVHILMNVFREQRRSEEYTSFTGLKVSKPIVMLSVIKEFLESFVRN